ncbi:MAG: hypothetical protein AB1453_12095 [Chloroflexota bacterium]
MIARPEKETLCPRGFALLSKSIHLADEHGSQHPLVSAAWDEYIIHVRGTSNRKGCPGCKNSTRRSDEEEE